MSKLIIKYIDNSKNKRDITGITTIKRNEMLEFEDHNGKHYIPLMNVKEIIINGANDIKWEG